MKPLIFLALTALDWALTITALLLFFRVVLDAFLPLARDHLSLPVNMRHPAIAAVFGITEPVLLPVRKLVKNYYLWGSDWTPTLTLLILLLLRNVFINMIGKQLWGFTF